MSPAATAAVEAPFLGLRYFDEEDSHLFFGRDDQVNDILERLRRSRLVMVMGGSGSGKSSLVRAGVLPRLKAGFLGEMGSRWRIAKMRPGSSPIASLARELQKALATDGLEVTLRRGPLGLVQAVRECRLPAEQSVLVIADQFEELFRYQRESQEPEKTKEEATSFVKLLLEATNQHELPIYVIATMRSDYLGNCAQFRDLPERINDGLYLVPRMRRDQLEQAITGPLAVEDAEVTPRLVQKLLNDTGDDPDQLPVLQHTLLRTWNTWNRAARPLDLEDLGEGGMQDDLSLHADEIYAALSTDHQRIARALFQQLSERDAEGREIRRPAPVALVAAVAGASTEAVEAVVAKFAAPDAALLYRNEDGHLDITHESLIRKWTRIQGEKRGSTSTKGWIQEEVEARDQFRLVVERATKNDTLMGRALDDATKWRALGLNEHWGGRYTRSRDGDTAFQEGLRFIERCEKEESARRRHRKGMVAGAVAALVLALAVFAYLWRSAEQQRENADRQARTAESANSNLNEVRRLSRAVSDPLGRSQLSLLLSVRAASGTMEGGNPLGAIDIVRQQLRTTSGRPLVGHSAQTRAAAFSADRRWLATASEDGAMRLWNLGLPDLGERSVVIGEHNGAVRALAFSPDGRWLASGGVDGAVRLWSLTNGGINSGPQFRPDLGAVHSVAFAPSGEWLAFGTENGNVCVWRMSTSGPLESTCEVGKQQEPVRKILFSRKGRWLATAEVNDGVDAAFGAQVALWDATAVGFPREQPQRLIHAQAVGEDSLTSFAFNANETRLAVAYGYEAQVWDLTQQQPPQHVVQRASHTQWIRAVALSPDNRWLATGSIDTNVKLWDLASGGKDPILLEGHSASVRSVAFSDDGRSFVTAGDDAIVRLWDVSGPTMSSKLLRGQERPIEQAVFSPGASPEYLLSLGEDTHPRLWSIPDPTVDPIVLRGHEGGISSTATSPDGEWVASGGADRTILVRSVRAPRGPARELQLAGTPQSVAFSADGRWLAAITDESTDAIYLWSLPDSSRAALRFANGAPPGPATFGFSPDSHWLLSGTWTNEGTVNLWDVSVGAPSPTPRFRCAQRTPVRALSFSRDGRYAVTGSHGSEAHLWDLMAPDPCGNHRLFGPHGDVVAGVAIAPDSQWIATASFDGKGRLWDTKSGRVVTEAQFQARVTETAFSPDGQSVAFGSWDRTVQLLDMRNPSGSKPMLFPGHDGRVFAVVFSPDSRWLITAGEDRTIRMWDRADVGETPVILRHDGTVNYLGFSPGTRRLVTAGLDGTVRLWGLSFPDLVDVACRTAGRQLTQEEIADFLPGARSDLPCANQPPIR